MRMYLDCADFFFKFIRCKNEIRLYKYKILFYNLCLQALDIICLLDKK